LSESDRGFTLSPMELKVMLLFLRLVGAILLEGLVSFVHILVFLARRQTERARVHDLILGRRAALGTLGVLLAVGLAVSGCRTFRVGEGLPPDTESSVRVGGTHPGTSFETQWDELLWSTRTLFSWEGDRESLEDDLRDFGASDPEALSETIEMLGW